MTDEKSLPHQPRLNYQHQGGAVSSGGYGPAIDPLAAPVSATILKVGGSYNWKNQPERLIYTGLCEPRNGRWHQFELVDKRGAVWCEVLDGDLHMMEETPAWPVSAPAPTGLVDCGECATQGCPAGKCRKPWESRPEPMLKCKGCGHAIADHDAFLNCPISLGVSGRFWAEPVSAPTPDLPCQRCNGVIKDCKGDDCDGTGRYQPWWDADGKSIGRAEAVSAPPAAEPTDEEIEQAAEFSFGGAWDERVNVATLRRFISALPGPSFPVQAVAPDTARLDWLQANKTGIYRSVHDEIRPTTAGFDTYEKVQVFDGWCTGMRDEPMPTVREAIDAAMAIGAAVAAGRPE